MTLADEDSNSIPTDNANLAIIGNASGACLEHVWSMSGASSGSCLGHQLGHVWGIIWGMSGGIIWGMSGASSGACLGHYLGQHLGHIVNNGQQSALLHASVMPFLIKS